MKRIKTLLPAAALAASAMLTGSAHATIIISEDFTGSATSINGTAADIGGVNWVSPSTLLADGSIQGTGAGTATLAFTPADGFIYTLDASFTGITGDGNWIALGFVNGQGTGTGTVNSENRFLEGQTTGVAWMYARGNTDANDAFLGNPGAASNGGISDGAAWTGGPTGGGNMDLRIVLDTTGVDWTATWYAKRDTVGSYTTVRNTASLLSEDITSVGFGKSNTGVSGTITSFSLTAVPEPGSLALIGLGGLCLLKRRRRS